MSHSIEIPQGATASALIVGPEGSTSVIDDVSQGIVAELQPPAVVSIQVDQDLLSELTAGSLVLGLGPASETVFTNWTVPWEPQVVSRNGIVDFPIPGPGDFILYWFPDREELDNIFTSRVSVSIKDLEGAVPVTAPAGMRER